jgi:crotonobetainyl-CoA:carnitine CoA-transferase CaiB-like acyl-CoA transferase
VESPDSIDESGEITERLSEVFATKPAAEWVEKLGPLGAAVGPVNLGRAIVDDPQNTVRRATVNVGGIDMPANPVRLRRPDGSQSATVEHEPPIVGEDTDWLFGEAGFSKDEIEELRAGGVI